MQKYITSYLFFLLSIVGLNGQTKIESRNAIVQGSKELGLAFEMESINQIVGLFDTNATLLPEYHRSLWGITQIQAYYTMFFEKTKTKSYQKEPFELLKVGPYYVESGTFEHDYKTPNDQDFKYKGKYMTYWEFQEDGNPKVIAHISGASHYFEADKLDFVTVPSQERPTIKSTTQWEREIEQRRKQVYQAVLTNNTQEQMKSYAEDANYMTYYDPPFIGKEQITAYFKAHNNTAVQRDSLMTRTIKVIDIGDHALKFGEYYVEWTWEKQPSFISGKGLTLYKRMEDGSIKIFRQMINHSMPASPKEN